MGLFSKFFHGMFYVVDEETLKKYLESELNFSLENNLEASANFNIYFNGEKHHIQIWNYAASEFEDEKAKGLIIYCDEGEYKTLEELYGVELNNLPDFFKIELIDMDNTFLNEYKKAHPELKPEDY